MTLEDARGWGHVACAAAVFASVFYALACFQARAVRRSLEAARAREERALAMFQQIKDAHASYSKDMVRALANPLAKVEFHFSVPERLEHSVISEAVPVRGMVRGGKA